MKPLPSGLASTIRKRFCGDLAAGWVWVGSGVSEVQAGFWASLAGVLGA